MTNRTASRSLSVYSLARVNSPHNIHTSNPRYFSRWSQDIEDRIALQDLSCDLYVGAQFLSQYSENRSTYSLLTKCVVNIWLFAQPDQPQAMLPGVTLVPLSASDVLAREWFLVVNHPRYTRLFVAHENIRSHEAGHRWEGILSSDRSLIARVERMLQDHIGQEWEKKSEAQALSG